MWRCAAPKHNSPVVRGAWILAGICLLSGCSAHRVAHAIADDAAACIPSDTIALAGLRLDGIRASPVYGELPGAWKSFLEPLHDATNLLIAYNGRDLLIVAQGRFASAPAGSALLGPTLALAGSPDAIRAATTQHATGRTGAPRLVTEAQSVANKSIWIAAEGHVSLPLAGNIANLNRMLQFVDYATLSAELNARVDIRATGVCHTAEDCRQLEESLRALVTLAATTARDPDLAVVLRTAQVTRDGSQVMLAASADMKAIQTLLR
jgi:hypothetical protein